MPTSPFNSRGFTLVEVMFAIVILMVGMLGLIDAVGMTALQNLNNQLRDEAVMIGEKQMADLQKRPFSMMTTAFGPRTIPSRIRGTAASYQVTRGADLRSHTSLPDGVTDSYQLFVQVAWTYKNRTYNHDVWAMRVYKDGI